jgi:enoyl-[acyl-carrier protein] reductase I
MSSGITGEVMHVDSGYHAVGMCSVDSAAETAELLKGIAPKDKTEAA